MNSKKAPSTKKPTRAEKSRAQPPTPASATPQPETVQRYDGQFVCVIGLPKSTKEALGPDQLKKVIDHLNTLGLNLVFQDELCVVNLLSHILATEL